MAHPEFMTPTFLTAEWRWLAMLNYEIDPAVLTEGSAVTVGKGLKLSS